MRVVLMSHIGNSRQNHEDNAIVANSYLSEKQIADMAVERKAYFCEYELITERRPALLAVSDGMGGHSSGEIASYMTVKYLSDNCQNVMGGEPSRLVEFIGELNKEVLAAARTNPAYKGMGATLCGAVVSRRGILGFNVGDSRMYSFSDGELVQISKDHTEGQRLYDLGLLTKEELGSFQNRKAVYKHIGMSGELYADVYPLLPCKRGAYLLLCSDGLTDALSDSEIAEILALAEPIGGKGQRLMNLALGRNIGRGDNITLILAEL